MKVVALGPAPPVQDRTNGTNVDFMIVSCHKIYTIGTNSSSCTFMMNNYGIISFI